jgi:excisionase family DNA binding protein
MNKNQSFYQMTDELPLALSVDRTAKELGLAVRTIREKIKYGEIGYANLGRRVVIPRAALVEYLEQHTIRPAITKAKAQEILSSRRKSVLFTQGQNSVNG